MKHKIFIDGEAGTTGLEIKKRLSGQGDLVLLKIDDNRRKDRTERLSLYNEADIVFLCLPDSESKSMAAEAGKDVRIIDASTAHRTDEDWVYGLPELSGNQRTLIKNSNRVADPGCHATGFILLTRPLIDAGLISVDTQLSAHSITGYSGGGKTMIADYEAGGRTAGVEKDKLRSPGLYGLSQHHKHLPEMTRYSDLKAGPVFMPIVADYYRGMMVSIPLTAAMMNSNIPKSTGSGSNSGRWGIKDICGFYKRRYEDDPLISVRMEDEAAENGFLFAGELKGRDDLEIIICGNDERMTLVARYDNLGKGASGAAIQNMNLMLNRPEYEGLIR